MRAPADPSLVPAPLRPSRRELVGAAAGAAALPLLGGLPAARGVPRPALPVMVGSANALAGMKETWDALVAGGDPLDAAIGTVKVPEADPADMSVGYGGLPNEEGVVQLDAACMYGPTHNSGAVACLENIVHPSEVARLVMERTDHCLLVGRGAYEFARQHGHPHVDLLTEQARQIWLRWKETMSDQDDRLPPAEDPSPGKQGARESGPRPAVATCVPARADRHGTVHCSVLSVRSELACVTSTSGLAFKIPGRVGDSPIVGAGLYCDQDAGSAGSTGRGEAAILANGSFAIVELLRQGRAPVDAGLEVLKRIAAHVRRQARWQPALLGENDRPAFAIAFYALAVDGRWAGVTMHGGDAKYAVADPAGGPRLETLVPFFS
ncbi:MAG: N(4)-(beta-N-acetylglucosaminyl)-L-asparaginase [Planctomycetota bacterium]